MQVELDEIRKSLSILIAHVELRTGPTLELDKDFYWHLPSPELYNTYEKPSDLTIGQISENITEIREIVSGERPPLSYGLVWLAAILRAIGDSVTD